MMSGIGGVDCRTHSPYQRQINQEGMGLGSVAEIQKGTSLTFEW